jgi:hypothetical protein
MLREKRRIGRKNHSERFGPAQAVDLIDQIKEIPGLDLPE